MTSFVSAAMILLFANEPWINSKAGSTHFQGCFCEYWRFSLALQCRIRAGAGRFQQTKPTAAQIGVIQIYWICIYSNVHANFLFLSYSICTRVLQNFLLKGLIQFKCYNLGQSQSYSEMRFTTFITAMSTMRKWFKTFSMEAETIDFQNFCKEIPICSTSGNCYCGRSREEKVWITRG